MAVPELGRTGSGSGRSERVPDEYCRDDLAFRPLPGAPAPVLSSFAGVSAPAGAGRHGSPGIRHGRRRRSGTVAGPGTGRSSCAATRSGSATGARTRSLARLHLCREITQHPHSAAELGACRALSEDFTSVRSPRVKRAWAVACRRQVFRRGVRLSAPTALASQNTVVALPSQLPYF
jgi:hypothetical protein